MPVLNHISTSWLRGFTTAVVSSFAIGSAYTGYKKYAQLKEYPTEKKKITCMHEKLFRDFATVQYKGVLYMTPQDFLNSLIQESSDSHGSVTFNDADVQSFLRATPSHHKGSAALFRKLKNDGLISFMEYLFLVEILTKSSSMFETAFKMLDHDMNGLLDASEFVKLNKIIAKVQNVDEEVGRLPSDLVVSKPDFFHTTLVTHLFGTKAKSSLSLADFIRFLENVQRESLEVEFYAHSLGSDVLSSVGFARILLRHSRVSPSAHDKYIRRLKERIPEPLKIKFDDFAKFFSFLNTLDDFALAVRMYTLAGRPLTIHDFSRAVKACTGYDLDMSIIRTVYALFDLDGDGCLSHHEFIQIMRERRCRGLHKSAEIDTVVNTFRHCVTAKIHEKM